MSGTHLQDAFPNGEVATHVPRLLGLRSAMSSLRDVLGDPTPFLDAVFEALRSRSIDVSHYLLDHMCYRVSSQELYDAKKVQLAKIGVLLSEAMIAGRLICTYRLLEPFRYGHRRIPLVELPSPKPNRPYANGFEHVEFVVDEPLDAFAKRHPKIAFDITQINKARNADVSLQLTEEPTRSVKFHRQSLEMIIAEEKGELALPRPGGKRDAPSSASGTPVSNKEDVNSFRGGLVAAAHHIVYERMPAKVVFLHGLYTRYDPLNVAPATIHEQTNGEPEGKRAKSEVAPKMFPANMALTELLRLVKSETMEMIEMINSVKIWSAGNNFGVSIQEETVNELGRAEEAGLAVLESITKYYVSRAKVVSKVQKHHLIEDYVLSLRELDEKQYLNVRLCILDLRNNFAILHDLITKNIEKIKTPRSSHHLSSMI